MRCPYCSKEMEMGLIESQREIAWLPGSQRHVYARAKFHDGVVLSRISFFRGSAVIAWLCRGCEKVIIDYASGEADLNK